MPDQIARSIEWGRLLEETRAALASLRSDDLDKLSQRADEMFATDIEGAPQPGVQRLFGGQEVAALKRSQRLLGALLVATDRNRAVLRQVLGTSQSPHRIGEATSQ
jgi:hypothetical protein